MNNQVEKVRINLSNLIDMNNALLEGSLFRIQNAYELLSLEDNKDLGMQVGINLMNGAFWSCSDLMGSVAANFCCGVLSKYTSTQPPVLQISVNKLLTRFQNTSYQFNSDLEKFHSNPSLYWDNEYSGTVNNPWGDFDVTGNLSDLATITIPGKDDVGFQIIVDKLLYGLDQVIWYNLLSNFIITQFIPSSTYKTSDGYDDYKMEQNANSFYKAHPAYYNSWVFKNDHGSTYYEEWQNNLGTGVRGNHDNSISEAAANYLFNDLYNGYVNPNATQNTFTKGLYPREFVFNNMSNIKHTTYDTDDKIG